MRAKIKVLKEKIAKIRANCQHSDYIVTGQTNDHDGWSKGIVNVYEKRHCNFCGACFQVHVNTEEVCGVFYGC